MAERRFKPVEWAREEDVAEMRGALAALGEHLHGEINDLSRHQEVLELAILKVMQDVESMSDVLVDAGLLQPMEDEEEVDFIERSNDDVDPPLTDDDLEVEAESMSLGADEQDEVSETPAEREARIRAVHERRRHAVQEQGVRAFEDGNESPEAKIEDPLVDVTDVPEDGIVIETRPNG